MSCTTPALFRYCAVLLFAVPACFADVTASISGFVDASGQAQVCFYFLDCTPADDSFSFSDSNTQPTHNFSETRDASADDGTLSAGASVTMQQMVALNPGQLSTFIEGDDHLGASNYDTQASVDAVNQNTTTFESTGTFLLHVTGQITVQMNDYHFSSEDVEYLELSGPDGLIFSDFAPFELAPLVEDVNESWLLPAGTYTLLDSIVLQSGAGAPGGAGGNSFSLSLDADYTSVVPEPRWTAILALASMLLFSGRLRSKRARRV